MGSSSWKYFIALFFLGLTLSVWAGAPAWALEEREYDDATVLIVDAASGMIGVSYREDGAAEEKKLSFYADPDEVEVTNPQNHELHFSQVTIGDKVDLFTQIDEEGKEVVTEIFDYNQFDKDAL